MVCRDEHLVPGLQAELLHACIDALPRTRVERHAGLFEREWRALDCGPAEVDAGRKGRQDLEPRAAHRLLTRALTRRASGASELRRECAAQSARPGSEDANASTIKRTRVSCVHSSFQDSGCPRNSKRSRPEEKARSSISWTRSLPGAKRWNWVS